MSFDPDYCKKRNYVNCELGCKYKILCNLFQTVTRSSLAQFSSVKDYEKRCAYCKELIREDKKWKKTNFVEDL